jgi:hypothetical protein
MTSHHEGREGHHGKSPCRVSESFASFDTSEFSPSAQIISRPNESKGGKEKRIVIFDSFGKGQGKLLEKSF